jgi:hypothetical protein
MTQEEKNILIKDLSARLPYGVMLETDNVFPQKLEGITFDKDTFLISVSDGAFTLDWMTFRPYLYPLSSMTKKQKNSFPFSYSFLEALINGGICLYEIECITLNDMNDVIQGCYENHFDIHGLIPKGLAIDATGLDIY